jgi:hypothetical protein
MRVQATRPGFYNQFEHVVGEVFDLLDNPDGTMPIRTRPVAVLDKEGKPTGEFDQEPWLDEDGNAVHRDFAEDGELVEGRGNFKGERFSYGWMRKVPEDTPLGIYEHAIETGVQQARPVGRIVRPSNEPINAPISTPIRGTVDRTRRVG